MSIAKLLIVLASLAIIPLVIWGVSISYFNSEVEIRNLFEAKQKEALIVHDNVWKTIKQIASVPEAAAKRFAEVYPALMQGRYGNARGGALLSFVHESNPDFGANIKLYEKLSNAIESHRLSLIRTETELLDIARSYNALIGSYWGKRFLDGRAPLVAKVVASTRSTQAFETGVEDEVETFK